MWYNNLDKQYASEIKNLVDAMVNRFNKVIESKISENENSHYDKYSNYLNLTNDLKEILCDMCVYHMYEFLNFNFKNLETNQRHFLYSTFVYHNIATRDMNNRKYLTEKYK